MKLLGLTPRFPLNLCSTLATSVLMICVFLQFVIQLLENPQRNLKPINFYSSAQNHASVKLKSNKILVTLSLYCLRLTLNLTAVGRSAHTFFKGLFLKKSLSAKNRQKIPIPRKMPAESKSRVKYPSKNINLCLFYASEQAKPLKKATGCVSHLSRPQHFRPHPDGRDGWQWGVGGKPLNRVKIRSRQKCGRLFADCRPHRHLSIFCLNQKI